MTKDLGSRLDKIEAQLGVGTYVPGPWAALIRELKALPPDKRAAFARGVTRVSTKLHQRRHPRHLPFALGLLLEVVATVVGVRLLQKGLVDQSDWLVLAAAVVLLTTLQPLIKVTVGLLLGIRYSYFFLEGFEPRVKMKYGSYLVAAPWRRVVVHLAGTVGSPLALAWVYWEASDALPVASTLCLAALALLTAFQILVFVLGLTGARRFGSATVVRLSSAGASASELRERWRGIDTRT